MLTSSKWVNQFVDDNNIKVEPAEIWKKDASLTRVYSDETFYERLGFISKKLSMNKYLMMPQVKFKIDEYK